MTSRSTRLTALVSEAAAALIAHRAAAAGLSVSAYLRDRALDLSAASDTSDTEALRQVDVLVARMEADLDRATAVLAASLARMVAA